MSTMHRQRGWVGMIVLLLGVLIVAVLASTALKRYGLMQPGGDTATTIHKSPTPAAETASDPATPTPNYGNAIERARGVEAAVQKQADDAKSKIDDATK
jgi:hypothetical protein